MEFISNKLLRLRGFKGPRVRGLPASGMGSSDILKNYKDLKIWQKSYELSLKIYRITNVDQKNFKVLKEDISKKI